MAKFMGVLSFLVSIYMMIIFIRIIITWFSWSGRSGFIDILARITDPYLNWFRRFPALRIGSIDLSPIAALGVLSLVNRILSTLALYGHITIGIILAMILQIAWGIVSFILGFLIIVLVLNLICHLAGQNSYSPFWRIIETISQPVLFKINSLLFKGRIVNFVTSIAVSVGVMVAGYIILRILVSLVFGILVKLPF